MIQSGIYKFTSISQVCLGKVFMSKGFQWRFITNDIDYKINIDPCPEKGLRTILGQVAQCDKETHKVIQVFNSIAEASRITGIDRRSISAVCNGRYKTSGGYYWFKIINNNNDLIKKEIKKNGKISFREEFSSFKLS